jgi:predicted nucleic acid-binding protein
VAAVVDTSVLYALTDASDRHHSSCVRALSREPEVVIVPQPVLPEVCYLIASRLGSHQEAVFMRGLVASDWRVEPMSREDLARAAVIMDDYGDAKLGFVDAAVTAIAERLAVTRIYTLDRRDFQLVKPAHVAAFEVLP